MFAQEKWKHGIVERHHGDLRITVPPPKDWSDRIVLVFTGLFIASVLVSLFVPSILQISRYSDIFWKIFPALFFGVPLFFIFRGLLEQEFAEQVVTVGSGKITWMRKTKWWTRKRDVSLRAITDIVATQGWDGFGRIEITTKWQRYTVVRRILNEDAVRFARELKQASQTQ